MIPALFFAVRLIMDFRLWSQDPQILDYCFDLFALLSIMCATYYLGGFCFAKQSRAWQQLSALEADALYGDSFVKTEEGVTGIGNNVSLRYDEMDFEGCDEVTLVIDGATPLPENPITLRMQSSDGGEHTEMVTFRGGEGRGEQRFAVSVPGGVCSLTFVFLPGSCFDFYTFRFERP